MSHARPTAVVFDVGNVLYDWNISYLYSKLIDDPDRLAWFLDNVVTRDWHFQHDAGRDAADTTAELIAQFPQERALIEAYVPRWMEMIPGPVPGTVEIAEELAARGVPLFAITNFSHEFWPRLLETAPVFRHFKDIVVSGVEKLIKPEPAIFALAMDRFGLAPGEGLFIDDRADNVAAGKAVGLVGHVFVDAPTLRTALVGYGLLS